MLPIATCDVEVVRPVYGEPDRLGEPTVEWATETVSGVLPQPGGSDDLDASRPDGDRAYMTFHFPKGYAESLRGCRIRHLGREYRVLGDPQPYLADATPGPFDRAVEAVAVDG